jgi:hypothetical protein
VTAPELEDAPPELTVLVQDLEAAAAEQAAAALPEQVEAWLQQRTEGWSPEQLRALRDELRGKLHARRLTTWQTDPARWAREVAGVHPWSVQRLILSTVNTSRRVAVPSCHGAGKTFTAAVLAAWWLSVWPPGTAFVVSTAPTFAQVRAVLWREINRLHKAADLPGHVNQTEWHLDGELVGFGRKPADTDEHAFQGIHAERVLVLIDEAGGVPEQLWTAAEAVAVGDDDRIVAFGNPDDPTAHFERICRPDSLWTVLPVSAFDTPNLTGEQVDGHAPPKGLVTRRWVEDAAANWGTDSPLYTSKVLGQFPAVDEFGTVRPGDVAACRLGLELPPARLQPVELGVDVGGGGDMTSIRARHGARAGRKWEGRTPDPEQVVDLVRRAVRETDGTVTAVKVDAGGIGWGMVTLLRNALRARGIRVVPVNFGARSAQPDVYKNVRAELWWGIGRELSQARGWDLSAVDDTTAAQLLAPRWHEDTAGRIVIEPKEDVIERTGRSPDDADALLLAFYRGTGGVATVTRPTRPIPTGATAAAR